MRNVFIVYMPLGNHQAMVHYEDTIKNRVSQERIEPFLTSQLRERLRSVFADSRVAVWGSQPGPHNRARFERMSLGDYLLIVVDKHVKAIGKIAAKADSAELARELWKPLRSEEVTPWSLVYFIANVRELNVPFSSVAELFGYAAGFKLRGFTSISDSRLTAFHQQYDDLYSILVRLESGMPVDQKRLPEALAPAGTESLVELEAEEVDLALQDQLISEHVRMQFTLARLGIKAGEKVWVPVGDKEKLRRAFRFDAFDQEFSAGLDLPHSYIENIDVVWRKEFRIAAAYEIENSTAIYSGLLRFSDLLILAPNTVYPMFVVAPANRKNRVREQLRRPTFKEKNLGSKVRFLSYETVDAIDQFFSDTSSGVSVDLIEGRAETVL